MKKYIVLSLIAAFFAFGAQAQVKIAHTDADSILRALPETLVQQKVLENYGTLLDNELKKKEEEFKTKLEAFEKDKGDLPQIVVQERVKQLQQLEKDLYEYQQNAQTDLGNKRNELLSPILERIQKGIDEVAKEQGYQFVLPSNVLLYADPAYDITQLVIKKLTGK